MPSLKRNGRDPVNMDGKALICACRVSQDRVLIAESRDCHCIDPQCWRCRVLYPWLV